MFINSNRFFLRISLYTIMKCYLKHLINNTFTFNEEIHKYNTRIKSIIHLCQSCTFAGLRSVSHRAAV